MTTSDGRERQRPRPTNECSIRCSKPIMSCHDGIVVSSEFRGPLGFLADFICSLVQERTHPKDGY